MHKTIKNILLNYIPSNFEIENTVNFARIYDLNNKPIFAISFGVNVIRFEIE